MCTGFWARACVRGSVAKPRTNPRSTRLWLASLALLGLAAVSCGGGTSTPAAGDVITVGALLPFTGSQAAIGNNLEQAMILAAEDINAAGGVNGRRINIASRDSNSGSARGFEELLGLLYEDKVAYLVGPEEDSLVNEIVPDVKGLDVLNILPGYASPSIERHDARGAWIRLAPSPAEIGCAMAKSAIQAGSRTANALVELGDYNQDLAAEFNANFLHAGGEALPSVTVEAGRASYSEQISSAFGYHADRTLLIAHPATAATVVSEWGIAGHQGTWYLAPTLENDAFLLNIPFGALDGTSGVSPSLSLLGECQGANADGTGAIVACARQNATAFGAHFTNRWGGPPFSAAHFYYDAVVLLAMGLEFSNASGNGTPRAPALQATILRMNAPSAQAVGWQDLPSALTQLRAGTPLRYVGAAAEYLFDEFGAAKHVVFDGWTIVHQQFVSTGPIEASCPRIE